MDKLRGAIMGCGMISEFHLRAWQRIDDVEVVALGNRTISRAEARRDEFAPTANIYGTLPDLLNNEELDFLDVLTPPALHKEHCLQALNAGLDVICQKPIADNLEDACELVDAFEKAGQKLVIHENHRYRPWFREILRRAADGFFGTIRFARFEQFDPREPPEAYKLESDCGVLLEYGTHIIDMIHALLGVPSTVTGTAHRLNARVSGESLVHLTLEYSDATACMDIAWKPTGLPQGNVLIVGDSGEAIYNGTMTRGDVSRFRLIEKEKVVVDQNRSPYEDYVESFHGLQRDVVSGWLTERPVPQSARNNLQVLETAFAGYDAIATGHSVVVHSVNNGGEPTPSG